MPKLKTFVASIAIAWTAISIPIFCLILSSIGIERSDTLTLINQTFEPEKSASLKQLTQHSYEILDKARLCAQQSGKINGMREECLTLSRNIERVEAESASNYPYINKNITQALLTAKYLSTK